MSSDEDARPWQTPAAPTGVWVNVVLFASDRLGSHPQDRPSPRQEARHRFARRLNATGVIRSADRRRIARRGAESPPTPLPAVGKEVQGIDLRTDLQTSESGEREATTTQ